MKTVTTLQPRRVRCYCFKGACVSFGCWWSYRIRHYPHYRWLLWLRLLRACLLVFELGLIQDETVHRLFRFSNISLLYSYILLVALFISRHQSQSTNCNMFYGQPKLSKISNKLRKNYFKLPYSWDTTVLLRWIWIPEEFLHHLNLYGSNNRISASKTGLNELSLIGIINTWIGTCRVGRKSFSSSTGAFPRNPIVAHHRYRTQT